MKKFLSLLFAALIVFGVVSCGGNKGNNASTDTNAAATMDADTNAATDMVTNVEPTEEDKKEAMAADKKTEAAVEDLVEEDSGQSMGLE